MVIPPTTSPPRSASRTTSQRVDAGCNSGGGPAVSSDTITLREFEVTPVRLPGLAGEVGARRDARARAARSPGRSPATSSGCARVTSGTSWCSTADAGAGDRPRPEVRSGHEQLPPLRPVRGAPGHPRGRALGLRRQGGAVRRRRRRERPLPARGGRGAAGGRLPRAPRPRGVRRRRRRRARDGPGHRGGRPGVHERQPDPGRQQARLAAGPDRGLRGAQEALPRQARRRRGRLLLLPVRARGGLRRGRDEDQGRPRRRRLGAQRRQAVDHQRRRERVLHRDGGDRPGEAQPRHLGLRRREVRRGRLVRGAGEEAGDQGQPDPRGLPRQRPRPRRPDDRRGGDRLRDRDADPRPHPRHHRRPGGRRRAGGPRPRARATPRSGSSSARRSPTSRGSSSCSPTWA